MDKNAIKKYAVWARNELIARVTQKAQQYGITEMNIIDAILKKDIMHMTVSGTNQIFSI